jgi:hypothetical protein
MEAQQIRGQWHQFPLQKRVIFRKVKNQGIARRRTEVRRTSVPADFVRLWLIDAEIAEKGHLWMETG